MKRFQYRLVYILLFLMFLAMLFVLQFKQSMDAPIMLSQQSVIVEIPTGLSLRQLTQDLSAKGIITHPKYFIMLARIKNLSKTMQAGEYEFELGITPRGILSNIATGKVRQHRVTFIAGWTFNKIMQTLNKQTTIKHRLHGLPAKTIMSRLGHPNVSPEGVFFPDTYSFARGTQDIVILQKAYDRMQTELGVAWKARSKQLPYHTSYEALIVASLLEKETAIAKERRLIAGIIKNRLQRHMPLQMDPTVIYGLGPSYKGKLTTRDLQQQGPYNTYTKKGLPPTPIAIPSKDAIEAALNPLPNHYLFFVAKGDGHHQFSRTLAQHNKAVKNYKQHT